MLMKRLLHRALNRSEKDKELYTVLCAATTPIVIHVRSDHVLSLGSVQRSNSVHCPALVVQIVYFDSQLRVMQLCSGLCERSNVNISLKARLSNGIHARLKRIMQSSNYKKLKLNEHLEGCFGLL